MASTIKKLRGLAARSAEETDGMEILCARCYSLMHYGKVKSDTSERLLPRFDLGKIVGKKMQQGQGRRQVVLCVVDLVDFDGSLPREALRSLVPNGSKTPTTAVRLILVANKRDLLPSNATTNRLKKWVRSRIREGGIHHVENVHLVSCKQMWGIEEVLVDMIKQVGVRGDVWVVGAQNAGKSSLLNALRKAVRSGSKRMLTTAVLPGTTLGIVEVKGFPLPKNCHVYDTPGVKHNYQITTMLPLDEVRMLLPRKMLKPRTYRVGAGYTLLIGGLAQVDVISSPGPTLYLTLWASFEVSCHMGKTEVAKERRTNHIGQNLRPPLAKADEDRMFPELIPCDASIELECSSWKESAQDIHIAGLGWIAVGAAGSVALKVWTLRGVAITTHRALMPDFAQKFEKLGFSSIPQPRALKKKKRK